MSRIYAAWNYRTKEIEFLPELPSNYADYIQPVHMARYEHYVAQGESPIEAALAGDGQPNEQTDSGDNNESGHSDDY